MKLHVDYFIKNMKDTFDVYPDRIFLYSIPLIFSLRLDAYDFSIVLLERKNKEMRYYTKEYDRYEWILFEIKLIFKLTLSET